MPIVPTKRLASFAFFAALVAVVAGFVPAAKVPMLALDVILLLAAIADVLALRGPPLEVERQAADIFSVGRANVVTITRRNPSSRAVTGVVGDDPIEAATRTGIPAEFTLTPQGTAVVKYEVTPTRRGGRTFDAIGIRRYGPLGLVHRQERVSLPAEVDVYPDVHAARALELLRRQGRADMSLGSRRVRGGDTEFERLRPYARGDEIRHVDWRASARRDDITVRHFQAESNQNVMFAIDVGRGMRGESSGLTSVDHALNAALLAADVALRGGDKAGFFAFDDVPRAFLPPTGGRAGSRKLTRAVHDLEAGIAATDYRAAMMYLQSQVRARSLLVVFTHFLEGRSATEFASSLRALRTRHLPLCVLMRDPDVEALVSRRVVTEHDLFVRAAAAETLAARDALIRSLRNAGVLVLDALPSEVTPSLVASYLEIKARRLL